MTKTTRYRSELAAFEAAVATFEKSKLYPHTVESLFEALNDWSLFHSIEEVKIWFKDRRASADMDVVDVPINDLDAWTVDKATGNISHQSGDFFVVHGIRVTSKSREVSHRWDQPIVTQVGYDGGLLGIIRKRFQGIPHYLCEAKMEPGNYGKVQISPTLQATFSNLRKAHQGRRPHFADLFENVDDLEDCQKLYSAWLAEDGGRLNLKRNRGMLVEVSEDFEIVLPNENFIWLSLYQIKRLLQEDAWINPHVRGILAHV